MLWGGREAGFKRKEAKDQSLLHNLESVVYLAKIQPLKLHMSVRSQSSVFNR